MERPSSPDRHIEAAKRRLGHLAGVAAKTLEAECRILAVAEDRLRQVEADLQKLRPRVYLDQDAADDYQRLVLERGQLALVIAQARQVGAR